jgi:hypothetical protein
VGVAFGRAEGEAGVAVGSGCVLGLDFLEGGLLAGGGVAVFWDGEA